MFKQPRQGKIHFIGIGGIGVSALAKYYLTKGCKVSGSDLVTSEITKALKKQGARIFIGKHKPQNLPKDSDPAIYSPAVPPNNPEFKEAKRREIEIQSYPEALGELTKKHFTIAVSGTHGKSTTTAMIALILIKAGLDPTVIVGTKLKEFGDSNCRVGKSEYLVIEADEHFASFLNYWPKIIVLTNIEKDHLDYYNNLNNILKTFKKYITHLPKDGVLVFNRDDENAKKLSSRLERNYSIKQREARQLRKILKVPGEHNIYNALAALTVARILKIPDKVSFKAISGYRGAWRRFDMADITFNKRKLILISDYAHHPTEVKATLKAVREKYPKKKVFCIFQPHQYQRTYYLFNDFVKVFRQAQIEKSIITDIYDVAGRERKGIQKRVSSEKLVRAVNDPRSVIYLPKDKIISYLKKNLKGGEILIVMGAGDIYDLSRELAGKN